MKVKKLLSTFAALAIAASSFAGLGINASAANEEVTATVKQVRSWSADNKTAKEVYVSSNSVKAMAGPSSKSSNFPGMGAVQFQYTNTNNWEVLNATLSFTGAGDRDNRAFQLYCAADSDYDFSNVPVLSADADVTTGTDAVTGIYSEKELGTVWNYSGILGELTSVANQYTITGASQVYSQDVTDYIKSVDNTGYATFVFSNALGTVTVTDYSLKITYKDPSVALYTATFTEKNGVTPVVTIYSDEAMSSEVENGQLMANTKYYYKAVLAGYEDYTGDFTVETENPNISYTMTAKVAAGAVNVSYKCGNTEIGSAQPSVEGKYVGDTLDYYYPKYIDKDGSLYKANTTTFKGETVTLTAEAQEKAVEYTKQDVTVYALVEYDGADNYNSRENLSNGKASVEVAEVTAPVDGVYTLEVLKTKNTNDTSKRTPAITINNVETGKTVISDNNGILNTIEGFELKKGDKLAVNKWDSKDAVDYILITKTGELAPSIASVVTTAPEGMTAPTAPEKLTAADDDTKVVDYSSVVTEGKTVTTIYVKVNNGSDAVKPVITLSNNEVMTVTKASYNGGYFICQYVGDDNVTVKSVTYEGATEWTAPTEAPTE